MNRLLAASVLVASMAAQAALAAAVPGSAAPDFSLPDITGKPQKLSDYRGKYVVIEWFNQGCPFVQKHYESGNMQGLQKRFTDKGVVWLAVSSNNPRSSDYRDPQQMKGVMKDWKMSPTAFILDQEGKVGRDYGARATPHMFVVDPGGQVIYAGAIDDKATWRPEDTKTARNWVAQALEESLAGKPVTQAATAAYGCSVKY